MSRCGPCRRSPVRRIEDAASASCLNVYTHGCCCSLDRHEFVVCVSEPPAAQRGGGAHCCTMHGPALAPRTAAARRTPSSRTCSRPPPPAVFLNARRHHVPPAPDALWNAQRHHAARRVHGYRSTHRTPDAAPPPNPCLRPCPRAQPVGGHHARSIKSTPDGRRPVAHRLEIHRPAALPAPGRWAAIPPFTIHLPLEAEAPAQIPQPTRAQNILNTFCSGLLPTDVPGWAG